MSEKKKVIANILSPFDTFEKNPWAPFSDQNEDRNRYVKIVRKSRFFYRYSPIISSVINRIAEIGATDIIIERGSLNSNESSLLDYVRVKLQRFLKDAIREILLSGLLFTEVFFEEVDAQKLRRLGIKYLQTAILPSSISFRNPENLILKSVLSPDDIVFYYKIPDKLRDFILNDGVWTDTGEKDEETYRILLEQSPTLVENVKKGVTEFRIEPNYEVIKLNSSPDTPYPTPYLTPIIPILEHKRNLRRMDYAMAARAIISILHVKVGNDEYPLTKDDEEILDELRAQFNIPAYSSRYGDYERIFQLFTNHTVDINWVTPPIEALLNTEKYDNINEEILLGLGFPRYLIVGETRRSQAGNADIANSIIKTILQTIRNDIIIVIRQIMYDIMEKNKFRGRPGSIRLAPFNLVRFKELFEAYQYLYETANISRRTLNSLIGASYIEEAAKMKEEQEIISKEGLREFTPMPFSGKQPTDLESKEE